PLEFAKPFGWCGLFELSINAVVFSADAFRKITFAKNSIFSCVSASMMRTPVARPVFGSVMMLCAIECGRSVMLPVSAAAGIVEELLEKYAPYGQPRWQRFRP